MLCFQTLVRFPPHSLFTHMHTEKQNDAPYALHICVRNRLEIEHDLFIVSCVKSNQLWTKARKRGRLRLGSDPHLIVRMLHWQAGLDFSWAFEGIRILCVILGHVFNTLSMDEDVSLRALQEDNVLIVIPACKALIVPLFLRASRLISCTSFYGRVLKNNLNCWLAFRGMLLFTNFVNNRSHFSSTCDEGLLITFGCCAVSENLPKKRYWLRMLAPTYRHWIVNGSSPWPTSVVAVLV